MESAEYLDPFDFSNDDYVESQAPDFNSSFMEQFRGGSSDEEEFTGFTREAIFFSRSSRVRSFHQRPAVPAADPEVPVVPADKENVDPAHQRCRKRKADPSR